MSEDRDFAGICYSFLAGIAAGTLFTSFVSPLTGAAAATPVLTLIFILIAFRREDGRPSMPWLAAIYALCGGFCALCGATAPFPAADFPPAQKAARALKEAIDSIPWDTPASAPLLKALLTGDRADLPRDISTAFRQSGASHLLALSGLHLGIIYLILSKSLSILGKFPLSMLARYILILSLSGFFTIMTGASPSLVRAFLFIVLRETARLLSRPASPLRILLGAMVIQLAAAPSLISSVAFQLSYLAMAGITILFPWLKALWPGWDENDGGSSALEYLSKKIWEASALTLSCQAFTAPLAWARFGTFPVYFLITNLLAMPVTSIAVTLGVAVLILEAAGLRLGFLVFLADKALSLLVFILSTIAGM